MANEIEFTLTAVDKASPKVKGFGRSAAKMAKTVAKVAAVAAAAGAAIMAFTNKIAKGIDRVTKFASRLGISAEALSTFQHVAEMAGISGEQFNMAVQRMTRRVGEAAQGMGEATGALAELGINAKEFSQAGLDEQMEVLADRFSTMDDRSKRLRLSFKLFDSEGTAMLQMLGRGSEAMKEAARDAEFLGVAISAQAAANAETFTDSMTRAQASLTGFGRGIANELMPVLSGLANRFADGMASIRESAAEFTAGALRSIFVFAAVAMQVFDQIREAASGLMSVEGIKDAVNTIQAGITEFAGWMVDTFITIAPKIGEVLIQSFKLAFEQIQGFGQVTADKIFSFFGGPEVDFTDALIDKFHENFTEFAETVKPTIEGLGEGFMQAGQDIAGALATTFGVNMEEARAMADQMMQMLQEFGQAADDTSSGAAQRARTFMEELQLVNEEFLGTIGTQQQQLAQGFFDTLMQGTDALGAAIGNAIAFGKSLGDALKQVGKQVLATMIQMLVKIAAQRLITSLITQSAERAESVAELSSGVALAGVNAFASTAAIPIIGPALAPAAASAAIAGATAAGAAGKAAGAAIGVAHGGLENVPRETTFLLDKGERVLSARQNEDLTRFLRSSQEAPQAPVGGSKVFRINLPSGGMMSTDAARELLRAMAEANDDGVVFDG